MRTEVSRGAAALELLRSPSFLADWQRLFEECPWASAYQTPAFAAAWYEVYRARFDPVLVTARDSGGELTGLLPLAVSGDGAVEAAGTEHAEYQCWLAQSGAGDAFFAAALERLAEAFPGKTLSLQYLPKAAPRGWLAAAGLARHVELRAVRRGLMDVADGSAVESSLRKSANKSRLKRLEREGKLSFERVTEPRAIQALLEELAPLCDLRQGAMYGDPPFQTDPLKAAFHRRLAGIPELLHVTVLRCGGRIASAHVNVDNRGEVVLALVAHAPWFSEHSPGKLHMLLLARELRRDGYGVLDLTPGGGYKDRFATRYDEVYRLRAFFSGRRYYVHAASSRARRIGRSLLGRIGVTAAVRGVHAARWRRAPRLAEVRGEWPSLVNGRRFWGDEALHVYEFDAAAIAALPAGATLGRNDVGELVSHIPAAAGVVLRTAILRTALARLESGARLYTRVNDGVLAGWACVSDCRQIDPTPELTGALQLPAGSALVYDVAVDERRGGADRYASVLAQPLRDALALSEVGRVFVAATDMQADLRAALERLGAIYVGGVFRRARLGTTQMWCTVMPTKTDGERLRMPQPIVER